MRCFRLLLAAIFLFSAVPAFGLELPCWDKPSCFNGGQREPNFPRGFVEVRAKWHEELDDIRFKMRQDADYSIFGNSQKDRVPYIHTEESQRAVDELAGDVISSIASPLTYRLPLFPDFEMKRQKLNDQIGKAMPELKTDYYSVHFLPRVDFSQTNPVSLDIKIRDGEEIGALSVRIHETEITAHLYKGILAVGGYSFRDGVWYSYLAGRIPMPW